MSRRIFLLTLRSVALLLGVGALLIYARPYVASRWQSSAANEIYTVLGVALLMSVYSLSLRPIVKALRARRALTTQVPAGLRSAEGREKSVYKYPPHLLVMVMAFGLFWVAVPFLSRAAYARVAPVTYVLSFIAAAVLFVIALRLFLFSVTIGPDGLLVKALTARSVRFDEINNVTVVNTGKSRQIAVSLDSGKVIYFNNNLSGFDEMASLLTTRSPSHPRA